MNIPDRETFDKVYGPQTLDLIKPNLWLRFRLLFAPTIIHDSPNGIVVYKKVGRTLVVLGAMLKPTQAEKAADS